MLLAAVQENHSRIKSLSETVEKRGAAKRDRQKAIIIAIRMPVILSNWA